MRGRTVTITYDLDPEVRPPYPGSHLFTMSRRTGHPTGTFYVVEAIRVVDRRTPGPDTRYRLTVTRLDGIPARGSGFPLWWYPRRRR